MCLGLLRLPLPAVLLLLSVVVPVELGLPAQDAGPRAVFAVDSDPEWLAEPGGNVSVFLSVLNDNISERIELIAVEISVDSESVRIVEWTCQNGVWLEPGEEYYCSILVEVVGTAGEEVRFPVWVEAVSESGEAVTRSGSGDPLEALVSVDIRTAATGVVQGVVRDESTTEPLDGVLVAAWHDELGFQGSQQTDALGAYELTGLEPGHYRLGAGNDVDGSVHTHVGRYVEVDLGPGEVLALDWELRRGTVIHGHVTDADTGAPVVDASVCIRNQDGGGACSWRWQTDTHGWWEIIGLAGTYQILVGADGYQEYLSTPIECEYEAVIELPIVLMALAVTEETDDSSAGGEGDGTQPAQDTQTELPHTGFGIGLLAIIATGTTLVGMTLISWRQRGRDDR